MLFDVIEEGEDQLGHGDVLLSAALGQPLAGRLPFADDAVILLLAFRAAVAPEQVVTPAAHAVGECDHGLAALSVPAITQCLTTAVHATCSLLARKTSALVGISQPHYQPLVGT
jgi:hypothetical protein